MYSESALSITAMQGVCNDLKFGSKIKMKSGLLKTSSTLRGGSSKAAKSVTIEQRIHPTAAPKNIKVLPHCLNYNLYLHTR